MVFVCHVTLQDHVIKALNGLMVRGLLREVALLPGLVAMGTMVVGIL